MHLNPHELNAEVYRLKPQGIGSRKNGLLLLIGVFYALVTGLLLLPSPPLVYALSPTLFGEGSEKKEKRSSKRI